MTKYIFFAACVVAFSGCASAPKDRFLLMPASLQDRQLESRVFPTKDEQRLLKDGAAILENMGYNSDLMNMDLGLITATKETEASGFTSTMMSILSIGMASPDNNQVYKAIFTTRPFTERQDAFVARLTLQRIDLNSHGEADHVETIRDQDVYKLFFQRLEASTFIEPDHL